MNLTRSFTLHGYINYSQVLFPKPKVVSEVIDRALRDPRDSAYVCIDPPDNRLIIWLFVHSLELCASTEFKDVESCTRKYIMNIPIPRRIQLDGTRSEEENALLTIQRMASIGFEKVLEPISLPCEEES